VKLIRDVLDKKLTDREDCPMGRVSGLLMHVGERSQPRITHVLVADRRFGRASTLLSDACRHGWATAGDLGGQKLSGFRGHVSKQSART